MKDFFKLNSTNQNVLQVIRDLKAESKKDKENSVSGWLVNLIELNSNDSNDYLFTLPNLKATLAIDAGSAILWDFINYVGVGFIGSIGTNFRLIGILDNLADVQSDEFLNLKVGLAAQLSFFLGSAGLKFSYKQVSWTKEHFPFAKNLVYPSAGTASGLAVGWFIDTMFLIPMVEDWKFLLSLELYGDFYGAGSENNITLEVRPLGQAPYTAKLSGSTGNLIGLKFGVGVAYCF